MKKLNRILALAFMVMVLFGCVNSAFAESEIGSITVCLKDEQGKVIDGFDVSLCKIADFENDEYTPTDPFTSSGISNYGIVQNPTAENAKKVLRYINDNKIEFISRVSLQGRAEFSDLSNGIYLVFAKDNQEYKFTPYFVFLPYLLEGKLYSEVKSEPKIELNTKNSKSIYVLKKWKDKDSEGVYRPEFIKVRLMRNGKVIKTAKLSEENGWSYIFTGLNEKGKYTVKERAVKGYTPRYDGDSENGFIITNSFDGISLPIAGQLWWPIGCIVVAGAAFVLLGVYELRGAKK